MSSSPFTLLDGRIVRAERSASLADRIRALGSAPTLAIIQVGAREDSTLYIRAKRSFAERIGIGTLHVHFPEHASQEQLTARIRELNGDRSIKGIILQLPLPAHIDRKEAVDAIAPEKDVDGLTSFQQGLFSRNEPGAVMPATARGVMELLEYYRISVARRKVAIIGRSQLVGAPIARACAHAGAHVIVCHSKTADIASETRKADIVIVAAGRPGLVGPDHLKEGAIVIDVGINRLSDGSIRGDVDLDAVKDKVSAITPVPGGVGQMTVLALFENLADICQER